MKYLLVALVAASILTGCSGGTSEKASDPAGDDTASSAATGEQTDAGQTVDQHAAADHAAATTPLGEAIPTGTEVTLTGVVGCGHCTYHVGNSCSTALKTNDGTVWILDGISEGDGLFENRFEGAEVTMAGVVSYVDGIAHLTPKMDADSPSEM